MTRAEEVREWEAEFAAAARPIGLEPFAPGLMSLTKTVPSAVPSLCHSPPRGQ
jgi:hypothetical protein